MLPARVNIVLAASLLLLVAGCAQVDDGADGEHVAAMTMSPGTNASTLFLAEETDMDPANVDVTVDEPDGLDVSLSDRLQANDNGTLAGWVTVDAASDADEGQHAVTIELDDGEDPQEHELTVTVEEPEDPFAQGENAQLRFSAITQDAELAFTNNETVANAPLAEADGYRDPQTFQAFGPIPLNPQGQLPEAMIQAVIGAGVNHTVDADVPEAFGPEFQEQRQPREETLDRDTQIPTTIEVPRASAETLLPPDPEEGDEIELPVTGDQDHPLPYEITELSEEQAAFEIALEQGDTVTVHEPWPDASEVTEVGENDTIIRTTPPDGEGDTLTWNEDWGETTEILDVNEDEIVLRHSPEVGTTYTQTNPQTGQSTQIEIVDITEDEIVTEQENPHPLAGETLTFIITPEQRAEPPQQPGQPGQGGQGQP